MKFPTLLGCLLAAASTIEAVYEYCGDCGCFKASEYAALLAMSTGAPTPGPTSSPLFETVTADGFVFTIGSDKAIFDGLTYSIGAGAPPVTALLDAELFTFGPRGVAAPMTTFPPFFPALASTPIPALTAGGPPAQSIDGGSGGTVVANGTATILVPPPVSVTGSTTPLLQTLPKSSTAASSPTQGIPTASSSNFSTTTSTTTVTTISSTISTPTSTALVEPSSATPISISSTLMESGPSIFISPSTSVITSAITSPSTAASVTATTSSSALPPVQTTNLNPAFISTLLQYTNMYRAINQAHEVVWDPVKATYAQNWANACNFVHSHGPYGENLAIGGYSNPALYVWSWYDEINKYTSYTNPNLTQFTNWGHFTQLVWNSTTSIGCGYATHCMMTPGFQYYLVCEYDTGNVVGSGGSNQYFISNVLTPTQPEPAEPVGSDPTYDGT